MSLTNQRANPFDQWARALDLWSSVQQIPDDAFYADVMKEFVSPGIELGVGSDRVASVVSLEYGDDSSAGSLRPLPLAYIPLWTYALELENSGWHLGSAWGSFDRDPLTVSSDTQIWRARRD